MDGVGEGGIRRRLRRCQRFSIIGGARERPRRADAAIVVKSADHDDAAVGGQRDRGWVCPTAPMPFSFLSDVQ